MNKTRKGKKDSSTLIQSYLMIAGSVIALAVFVVIPLLWVLRFSVLSYKGFGAIRFVGMKNFIRAFSPTSNKFWLAVKNTFVFAFGKLLVEIPLALILAFILTRKLKGVTFFRSVYFMPSMISVAVMGVVFNYIFAHSGGVVNEYIIKFGGEPVKWFSSATTSMIVLMIASIWQNFGINMLFFMTGLQSIPPEMYEAAEIDGATNTRQFFSITLPLLGPISQMIVMNAIISTLKDTDIVLTLTNGRPTGQTEVMMTYIYKRFFGESGSSAMDYGFGAALTVITAIILTIVALIYLYVTRKSSDVY